MKVLLLYLPSLFLHLTLLAGVQVHIPSTTSPLFSSNEILVAGVVNVYKGPFQKGGRVRATRAPTKTFMNLRTGTLSSQGTLPTSF